MLIFENNCILAIKLNNHTMSTAEGWHKTTKYHLPENREFWVQCYKADALSKFFRKILPLCLQPFHFLTTAAFSSCSSLFYYKYFEFFSPLVVSCLFPSNSECLIFPGLISALFKLPSSLFIIYWSPPTVWPFLTDLFFRSISTSFLAGGLTF